MADRPLYVDDILLADLKSTPHKSLVLLRVYAFDHRGDAEAIMQGDGGHIVDSIAVFGVDTLVACGRDEDCRASLDLAMACAEQREREWRAGPIGGGPDA